MFLFVIPGTTILVKDFKKTKQLIFVNWILYGIPAIVRLIKFVQVEKLNFESLYVPEEALLTWPLGFYPIFLNLVIQVTLLIKKQPFIDWTGFLRKKYPLETPIMYLTYRKINAGIFIIIYGIVWGSLWIMMNGPLGNFLLYYIFTTPCLLVWFIFSELIGGRLAAYKLARKTE